MLDQPIIAVALLFGLLVVGEVISILSRARIPMLFVVFIGYLILLWTGIFPEDIVDKSTLKTFAALMIAPLIVHMGTLIPFKIMKQQYKAVLIALTGIIIAAVTVLLVVTPILGYPSAVSAIGPLTGGIIAFLITSDKLQAIGLSALVVIPALVLALQSIVGLPLASNLLRKYSYKVRDQYEAEQALQQEAAATMEAVEDESTKKLWIKEKYATPVVILFQLFLGGALAVALGNWTGINYSLWALVIGFIGMFVGFYPEKSMVKANSFGIAISALIIFILPSLNSVTFDVFIKNIPVVLLILGIGAGGIILGGFIGSKLFKWEPTLGIPVALTAMFGFPGDYIICDEISRSTGRTEDEQNYIFEKILSPLLIGGFTTVTVASIVIASILMETL
ncbi:hypothetical protein [Rubeoparvulum massiliense]|uniref:hypothetical protein n=1 Tax=Rubeoparvulum massiliense TaxID=1631346 RepID=UPI00065E7CD9|nr:hypothetical protein [Rubeoparvulum massiliense]